MQVGQDFLRVKAHHHHRRDVQVGQVFDGSQTSLEPLDLHSVMVSSATSQFERVSEPIDANDLQPRLCEKNRVATTPATQVEHGSRLARIQPLHTTGQVGIGRPQGGFGWFRPKVRIGEGVSEVAHLVPPLAEPGGDSVRQPRLGRSKPDLLVSVTQE
jgi:hypothetical protein